MTLLSLKKPQVDLFTPKIVGKYNYQISRVSLYTKFIPGIYYWVLEIIFITYDLGRDRRGDRKEQKNDFQDKKWTSYFEYLQFSCRFYF
jgi:hypothetical protein